MARFFNTAGVCEPRKHYMLSAVERLPGVVPLIDKESYFVVHAPRQSSKTTCFHHLARELNAVVERASGATVQRFALELKVWCPGRPDPVEAGLWQLNSYVERLGLDEGTLVLFDQRPNAPPFAERGTREMRTVDGRKILVLRL